MQHLISIIIPTHNDAQTIGCAIKSVLLQTHANIEIIVVNDGSTDGTEQVVVKLAKEDPRIKYFRLNEDDPYRINRLGVNINAGYSARNFGAEHAKGDIITFQDADDISFADRLEVQHYFLERFGAVHAVVGNRQVTDIPEDKIGESSGINPENIEIMDFEEVNRFVHTSKKIPKFLRDPHSYRPENTTLVRSLKRIARKLLWQDVDPYPGSGNTMMVRREVFEKVRFRPLWEREWPSRKGRGADMDFNYNTAFSFGKSVVVKAPLYLWRT